MSEPITGPTLFICDRCCLHIEKKTKKGFKNRVVTSYEF